MLNEANSVSDLPRLEVSVEPNTISLNAALSACEKGPARLPRAFVVSTLR